LTYTFTSPSRLGAFSAQELLKLPAKTCKGCNEIMDLDRLCQIQRNYNGGTIFHSTMISMFGLHYSSPNLSGAFDT
jgi:hypothetical protein